MSNSEQQNKESKISGIFHSLTDVMGGSGTALIDPGDTVIAGEDNRKDLFQLDETSNVDRLQMALAASVVLVTDRNRLAPQQDGSFSLDVQPFRRSGFSPCAAERFSHQHVGGWCTGFLVGPDLVATAGHCGETDAVIKSTAYVFGFHVLNAQDPGTTTFNQGQVYFGVELVAHEHSKSGDFAVVRLDRVVSAPGAIPLRLRRTGTIAIGENVGVIGHPSGLPMKIAFGDSTVVMRNQDPWLIANLDTYGGNSGSPVFNAQGQVEGILVRGAKDYIIDERDKCFRSRRIENSQGSEAVTKASAFSSHIPGSP